MTGKRQRFAGFREKWSKIWSVEKKIQLVILAIIICMTIIAIVVSTVFSARALTKQNRRAASEQLMIMSDEYSGNLEQYKALMISIILDQSVQDYCGLKTEKSSEMVTGLAASNVYNMLLNMVNVQSNTNFIAVVRKNPKQYVYNGNSNLVQSNFEKAFQNDYRRNKVLREAKSVSFSFSDEYYRGRRGTITVYFPIYSVEHVDVRIGTLVMNLDDNILTNLQSRRQELDSHMYLTDMKGHILSGNTAEDGQIRVAYADKLQGETGTLMRNGKLINYQKAGKWNYYLVDEIPFSYMYRNCISVIEILLVSMVVLMILALLVSKKQIGRLYEPVNKIVKKMNDVSEGNLRTRFKETDMDSDSDSRKLTEGFNMMMDEIDVLIAQIKEEQEQMNQMRLNSLQSQIQPHFLYNTLECIHWQAAADGNREVSTMIKSLAQFYRICLSKGKDIIPLEKELEHIHHYLIIQNMRYGDIIDMEIQVPDSCKNVLIPKITLQPLVENAIYHGIKVKEGRRGCIKIYVEINQKEFYLVVSDDGEGMSEAQIARINAEISSFDRDIGYGINNVNKRIELMFGKQYGLKFYKNENTGVSVKIRLPGITEEAWNV